MKMKKIITNKVSICIETTGKVAGFAVIKNDNIVYEKNINNGFTHSVTLFDNINDGLIKSGVEMKDVDVINISSGPGSFTGIRIGIAAGLGLAAPYKTKINYVGTLDSLAYNVIDKSKVIVSMLDARCDRVYFSLYFVQNMDIKNSNNYGNLFNSYKNILGKVCNYKPFALIKLIDDSIINIDELIEKLNGHFENKNISFTFVGDGVLAYKDVLQEKLKIKHTFANNKNVLQKASSLNYVDGVVSDVPIVNYLLKSKAEREKEKI